jgi:hypothetical protein
MRVMLTSPTLEREHTMTKREAKAEVIDLKGLLTQDGDFVRAAVEALVQAALEAEMTEAIGAAKGERSETRIAYRSGHYTRSLITRVGTLELRVPQDRLGRFSTGCSNAISARRRRWSAPWQRCTCRESRPTRACPREGGGEGGHRGAVRAQLFGLVDQRHQQIA